MKSVFSYGDNENTLALLPEIILSGNNELTVDSLKEITEYSSERIGLSLSKINLTIIGDALEIKSLGAQRLTVSGNIFSLSFSSWGH